MAAREVGGRVVAGEDGEAEVFDPEVGRWLPAARRWRGTMPWRRAGSCMSRKGGPGHSSARRRAQCTTRRPIRGVRWRAGCGRGWMGSCIIAGGRMYIVAEYGE
ncbi:F-box protein AFR-like [Panicum miliaceum]|uniref:F-box protein AFR-like n=1 Tax=Panicum miliaceum TaxID=4540 RepID=A0A3L6SYX5_PANMI|nr:F-box protein AFR-like [Panicum miliaceum]